MANSEGKKIRFFDTSLVAFSLLAIMTAVLCYAKGKDVFYRGWDESVSMLVGVAPKIIGAILISGFAQVLVPRELVIKWLGEEAGFKGIVIACFTGILTPGGPLVSFPLIAALYSMGAAVGTLVAYLLSWELMGIQRIIVWELPIMGVKFTLLRVSVSLFCPLLAGFLAQKLTHYFDSTQKSGV